MTPKGKYLITMMIVAFGFVQMACSDVATQPNSSILSSNKSVSNSTVSKEEREKQDKEQRDKVRLSQKKALNEFLQKNYKGWIVVGTQAYSDICEISSPCALHLEKGNQSKVISIVLKEFEKEDGSTYWLTFEAKAIDLAVDRLDAIKSNVIEDTRDFVLANLDIDDCRSVNDAEREASYDLRDDYEGSHHDPRY